MSKAALTRQYIIEQTAPVFNKKGYAGTSMSDITEVTGLTKGAIYGNFENKDDVALAVFDYNMHQITAAIEQRMSTTSSTWEKLMVFPRFYRTAFKEKFLSIGCPIVNTAPEADDTHQGLHQKVNKAIARFDKGIQSLVKKGIKKGEIKDTTNPSTIASLMISLIEGGILLTKSTGQSRYLNRALDQVEKILTEIKD